MRRVVRAAAAALLALAAVGAGAGRATAAPLAIAGAGPPTAVGGYDLTRHALVVTPPATFTASVDAVPADGRLVTAVAVPTVPPGAAPLRFRVVLETEGATNVLYERVVDPGAPNDRRWFDVGRDLGAVAGRRATVRFEVTPTRSDAAVVPPAWWAPPEIASCADASPSVLLVTIDALRADHLGSYGYARPTTPHLDAFAADATRFAAAFSGGPKTIPSVPQILTGTYVYWQQADAGLGALLGADGTPSRAIVDNPYVANWLRGARPGFDAVQAGDLDARAITSGALRWLTAAGRCRATLYLHYLDTHTPYHAPARWARRFVDRMAAPSIGLAFDDVSGAWQGRYAADVDRQRIVDLYDGSLAYVDRQLGRLFRGLARRGRLDRTVVAITADHGEELWDHRQFFHGQSLYDELLHVPLLVRWPAGGRGRVVDGVVSTVDVLPTLAAAAGRPMPHGDGRDLAAARDAADAARPVFALVALAEPRTPERQAVRTAGMKIIHDVADGLIEVYDLANDPREKRNLGLSAPGAADLHRVLDDFRSRFAGAGVQLRLRSRAATDVRYAVSLTTDPPAPLFALDRLSLERGDRVEFGPRASAFRVSGTLAAGEDDQVRFDAPSTGTVTVTITLDGARAPAGTLRLGAAGVVADGAVELGDPRLVGAPSDEKVPDAPPVGVELWRVPSPNVAAPNPTLDAATRERLRQLGYAE